MTKSPLKYNSRPLLLLRNKFGGGTMLARTFAVHGIKTTSSTIGNWIGENIEQRALTIICQEFNINIRFFLEPVYASMEEDIILGSEDGYYAEQYIDIKAIVQDYLMANNYNKSEVARILRISTESINIILSSSEDKYPKLMIKKVVEWINGSPTTDDYIRLTREDTGRHDTESELLLAAEDTDAALQQRIIDIGHIIIGYGTKLTEDCSQQDVIRQTIYLLEKNISELKYLSCQQGANHK